MVRKHIEKKKNEMISNDVDFNKKVIDRRNKNKCVIVYC